MNVIDIIIIVLLAFGLIQGLMKGFIVELASLAALIAGIYGALHFSYFMVDFLNNRFPWEVSTVKLVAFVCTFIVIVLAVVLVGKLLTKLANLIALGILNRLLGGIFGVLKIAFLLSVLLLFFERFNHNDRFVAQQKLENSSLYEPLKNVAPTFLPSILEIIQEEFDWDKEYAS